MTILTNLLTVFAISIAINFAAYAGADVTIEDIDPSTAEAASKTPETAKDAAIIASYEGNMLNIQERLAVLGYYPTYYIDGKNLELTKKSVMRFQKYYGLKADGVFGPETATTLNYYTGTQHILPVPHYKTVYHYSLPSFYAN